MDPMGIDKGTFVKPLNEIHCYVSVSLWTSVWAGPEETNQYFTQYAQAST